MQRPPPGRLQSERATGTPSAWRPRVARHILVLCAFGACQDNPRTQCNLLRRLSPSRQRTQPVQLLGTEHQWLRTSHAGLDEPACHGFTRLQRRDTRRPVFFADTFAIAPSAGLKIQEVSLGRPPTRSLGLDENHRSSSSSPWPRRQKVGVFRPRPSEAAGGMRKRTSCTLTIPDGGIAKGSAERHQPSSVPPR